jgi:type I restriction enzyme S subunit
MPTLSLNASKKTKHTPAGEIPVDWDFVLLDQLSKRGSGHTPSKDFPSYWDGGIKWVSLADSSKLDRGFISETANTISHEGIRRSSAVLHPANTVILSRDAGVGKSAVLKEPMAVSQHFIAWTCGKHLDPWFLYHWLQNEKPFFERMAVGSTIKTIGLGVFKKLGGAFPPLPEQIRIAAILSTWDRAIETLESLIAAKDRRKQALMQQLLTGKKRLPGFEGNWTPMRMNKLLERVFRPIEWHEDLPLVLISIRRRFGGLFRRPDVKGSEYKTQDLHEVRANDFLISKRQVVHGAWALVTSEFEGGHISKEYAIFDNIAPGLLHMPFFGWLSQTGRMVRLARVSSTGVHIEKLIFDPKVFLRETISLPPSIEEQIAIATVLDTADRELALHRQNLATLRTQKRGLMQKLLTGKVRVKAP